MCEGNELSMSEDEFPKQSFDSYDQDGISFTGLIQTQKTFRICIIEIPMNPVTKQSSTTWSNLLFPEQVKYTRALMKISTENRSENWLWKNYSSIKWICKLKNAPHIIHFQILKDGIFRKCQILFHQVSNTPSLFFTYRTSLNLSTFL